MSDRIPSRLGRRLPIQAVGEEAFAFVPPSLPPDPPVRMIGLYRLLESANRTLGQLDGVTSMLPDTSFFLSMYVRKEAVLSSRIEGVQSSLCDLLLYENGFMPGARVDDVQEVSNCIAATTHGLHRLQEGFPVSLRLIRDMHELLMSKGPGRSKQPGEFRRSQNWIGGTRPGNAVFVPPPPSLVPRLMSDLETFVQAPARDIPELIRIGLIHVQFETIHPFLDGNGRLGRLLIMMLFCMRGLLSQPTLYPSLYFKTHRRLYYDLLQRARERGDWEAWLEFFLDGIVETAQHAVETAREIRSVLERDRRRIEALGRPTASALRVHQLLLRTPIVDIPRAVSSLGLSAPTVSSSIRHLEQLGIMVETTGRRRDRRFAYRDYIAIFERGTELRPD